MKSERVCLMVSHAYKGMRESAGRRAEGKTTLLGVGWLFPHCLGPECEPHGQSNKKD